MIHGFKLSMAAGLLALAWTGGLADGRAAVTPANTETNVFRSMLPNGLSVIIVRNPLAPVVTTVVNYKVGSDECSGGFSRHGPRHGTHDVPRQSGVVGGSTGGHHGRPGRGLRRRHAAGGHPVFFHRAGGGFGSGAAHRGHPDAGDVEHRRLVGEGARAPSSRRWRRICPTRNMFSDMKLLQAMFKGTPYEHDALGTRPSFDKTTGRHAASSFTTPGTRPTTPSWSSAGDVQPARRWRR